MKDGYYWVKGKIDGKWRVALWDINVFLLVGAPRTMSKDSFAEIGDYIETPDKYKEQK